MSIKYSLSFGMGGMKRTFLDDQMCVELEVVEPSWDLDPAAVHPGVAPLGVNDGQGHVSFCDPAQQLVPQRLLDNHNPIRGGEDGVGAFGSGHLPFPPADAQHAVNVCVVPTGQSDIAAKDATDGGGALAHCGGQQ